ncbi:UDP-N-acetylmuramoyl-L-alanyl-D-glutamate--2,6-diaminopimelate ligase [Helicobacter anatolicus]|uniref:UDP-N-acetylmuramoyl-L-alanyl-D-glutamate--2, 6-diaminopimelate ligase n=1 Tax=Helicobacter anatolicus TaxID=2905874 RepID=UPI001E5D2735|nr:UDP-N-acetylmuramoyl-L-alanyl-D-glutamate--2,6-diaminopimelate ligase [Helicobacter anatolicus]MCE3039538.1 UDP-N-acetylmuramoyl-L-alanyl-D-glutamate--2,6-diaminopimelate ligase [Helicobacter anatolicus]
MKITYTINFNHKNYNFLSDRAQEAQENQEVLFVQTPRNKIFAEQMRTLGYDILHYSDLKKYFSFPNKIIGITGTNGKTTTANLIYHILKDLGYKCAMLGTQGLFFDGKRLKEKGLTTPTILELYEDLNLLTKLGCEVLVMEVSSHAIEQQRIYGLEFAAKILTNITSDHLDYHKNLENYITTKNAFLQDEGLKIINHDDKNVHFNPKNAYTYSLQDSGADFCIKNYSQESGISADLIVNHQYYKLSSLLYGKHNLSNILASLLCIHKLFDSDILKLLKSLKGFCGVSGRMEVVYQNPLILVDFAHTHDGMEKIFQSFEGYEISVVFGAGGDRDKSKRPLMGKVAQKYAKKIYITSDNPRNEEPKEIIQDIMQGISDTSYVVLQEDRYEAIFTAIKNLKKHEVLLVLGKGDETYQILKNKTIDFDDRKVIKEICQKVFNTAQ